MAGAIDEGPPRVRRHTRRQGVVRLVVTGPEVVEVKVVGGTRSGEDVGRRLLGGSVVVGPLGDGGSVILVTTLEPFPSAPDRQIK